MEYNDNSQSGSGIHRSYKALKTVCLAGACGLVIISACNNGSSKPAKAGDSTATAKTAATPAKDTVAPPPPVAGPLDTALYNKLMVHMANGDSSHRWPVKTAYPHPGALLPFNRI